MSRIAYVNGSYVPLSSASVHIEDRGYQFADGVYEVVSIYRGRMIDEEAHLDRLKRSLDALQIAVPMSRAAMKLVFRQVLIQNRAVNALLYIQITRGAAKRDHAFPKEVMPSFVITCRRFNFGAVKARSKIGIKVSSQPDDRWARCDIKSISLLPNVLAKQAAREAGAFEAMYLDADGFVTEGSSTNMWMVEPDGTLVTRSLDDNILPGITRATLQKIAADRQVKIVERAFSLLEAKAAPELFLTSSTSCVMPIIEVDGTKVSDGTPGKTSSKLAEVYWALMEN